MTKKKDTEEGKPRYGIHPVCARCGRNWLGTSVCPICKAADWTTADDYSGEPVRAHQWADSEVEPPLIARSDESAPNPLEPNVLTYAILGLAGLGLVSIFVGLYLMFVRRSG